MSRIITNRDENRNTIFYEVITFEEYIENNEDYSYVIDQDSNKTLYLKRLRWEINN